MKAAEKPLSMSVALSIFLVFTAKIGLTFLFITLVLVRTGQGGDLEQVALRLSSDPFTLAAVQLVIFGGVLLLGLQLVARDRSIRETLALGRPRFAHLLAAVAAGLALALVLSEVDNVLREIRPMTADERDARLRLLGDSSPAHLFGLFLAIVIVAPFTEEALFRGLVLRGLVTTRGVPRALVLSSLLFGLSHLALPSLDAFRELDWTVLVVTTLAALYLGVIALGARSITPAIGVHAAHNAVALLPSDLLRVEGLNVLDGQVYHLPPIYVVASLGALVVAALFFRKPSAPFPRS